MESKVALVTGGARRVGAAIARHLHAQGMRVVIHYLQSEVAAQQLVKELNQIRRASAAALPADLNQMPQVISLAKQAYECWQRLDVLVNNASRYYPTPFSASTEAQWNDLFANNLKAPFFLAQTCASYLRAQQGCIINLTDINAQKPLINYPIYCIAKAGLTMCTRVLAKELAPDIRVNAIAPGTILWPEGNTDLNEETREKIIAATLLKRVGTPQDIADAVLYLVNARYVTGHILTVDGGKLLL